MYAGSNSNCYMTAGTPTATADPDLIVRSPQSDGGDRWYIISLDLPTTVYTQVFFDNGYRSRYPNAISIIYEELASLKEIYMDEFGIDVCWFTPTPYISYADECSTAYNATCNHVLDIGCENSSISSDGSIFLKSYHHKNIYNIFLRVPFPDTTENLKILYMGHDNCMVMDSVHILNPLNGKANSGLGLAMIMNFKSQLQETKTLVHEFGHFYGAKDHYGNGTPTTEEMNATIGEDLYSDYCIYGLHKDLASVCDSLTICEGCRITIAENKYRYGLE